MGIDFPVFLDCRCLSELSKNAKTAEKPWVKTEWNQSVDPAGPCKVLSGSTCANKYLGPAWVSCSLTGAPESCKGAHRGGWQASWKWEWWAWLKSSSPHLRCTQLWLGWPEFTVQHRWQEPTLKMVGCRGGSTVEGDLVSWALSQKCPLHMRLTAYSCRYSGVTLGAKTKLETSTETASPWSSPSITQQG